MPSALIHVMSQAAERAAKSLVRDYGEVEHLQVSRKGPRDFVLRANRNSASIIQDYLHYARPDWGFLTSQGVTEGNQEARFIIDSLDGAGNFLHALPHFCISIAAEVSGHVEACVIYDPVKNEFFSAERDKGAFLNQRRLRVSSRADLLDSFFSIGLFSFGSDILEHVSDVRRSGCIALDLAYIAAGRLEGMWEKDLSLCDIAAGVLLVKESGGYVSHLDGSQVTSRLVDKLEVLASNEYLYERFLHLVQDIDKRRS